MPTQQNYWFDKKSQGYGWVPISWQGWTITVIFATAVFVAVFFLAKGIQVKAMIATLLVATFALIVISKRKSSNKEHKEFTELDL